MSRVATYVDIPNLDHLETTLAAYIVTPDPERQQKGPLQMLQIVDHLSNNPITRDDTRFAVWLAHSEAKVALSSECC